MENLIASRQKIKEDVVNGEFDLIIIGGGITGTTVARDAALRGLSVCLFEKKDFASGTSSMTSKMIHGGLRYLMNYEFRLVREAALERKVAIETIPNLAEPMKFRVPLYKWNKEGKLLFKLGLLAYDTLAFPKQIGKHKLMSKEKLIEDLPILENDEIKFGASYYDVKTDDSRLTLVNALSAIARGAKVLNYFKVDEWEDTGKEVVVKATDQLTGESYEITSDALVIAGGPWTDLIENIGKNFNGKARLRTTWGTHILIDKQIDGIEPILLVNDDSRPIFIIPRINGKILAGTTDVDYDGHPDDIKPTRDDIDYILKAVNRIFPTIKFENEDVVSCFIGLRPLVYQAGGDEGSISRDHTIFHQGNVITVCGGKLTTARVMAKQVMNKVVKKIYKQSTRSYPCMTSKLPLFSGEIDDWSDFYKTETQRLAKEYGFDDAKCDMLVRWYGSELEYFETILKEHGNQELPGSNLWLEAQVIYSCRVEHAQNPIDFLRRRTPIMLERGNGKQCLDKVVELMSAELNWDEKIIKSMKATTLEYIEQFVTVPPL